MDNNEDGLEAPLELSLFFEHCAEYHNGVKDC
jgi:hypothetical protein